ncbi:MAG: TIM barrel protein [Bauldia sp.]|nr:TIM barrel protein [Bauldia sp.]
MNSEPYRFATRLNSFRVHGGVRISAVDAIRAVAAVPGISALELNYPQHFGDEPEAILGAAEAAGLPITALNLRWDGPDFADGAFTHPKPENREHAIATATAAVDFAAAHGIPHVILWMGPDGFDYPFQADYRALWEMEIEGFRRVAGSNPDVRVSVEYKPSDPRRVSLIRSMGDSLLAVNEVGLANFGVTLDLCHVLMAGEQPAVVAAQALRVGRLFGVHINDGYGPADDGMMAASVRPWHLLELLLEMRRGGFAGTIYFDTFPERIDPVAECAANVRMVQRLERVLDRLPAGDLERIQQAQDATAATALIHDLVLGAFDE